MKTWMQTYTGRKFDPIAAFIREDWAHPDVGDFSVADIAHSLSNLCRFGGHCRRFYSVAQHSVLVAQAVRLPGMRLHALLHDAHEAFTPGGDVIAPHKGALAVDAGGELDGTRLVNFRAPLGYFQRFVQDRIVRKFGLSAELTDDQRIDLRTADLALLAAEARDLMAPQVEPWELTVEPWGPRIEPLPPGDACDLWMDTWARLTCAVA